MTMIAIIPARGGSKRFPRKNIAKLGGKPLIFYSITVAQKTGLFDTIIVSTEDPEIKEIAEEYGASVMNRSQSLAADDATVPMVCLDIIERLEKEGKKVDTICILLPTCPLRIAADIKAAYERFTNSDADYLMSLTDYHYSPFRALEPDDKWMLKPYFGRKYLQRDQQNPTVYVHCGSFIFAKSAQLKKDKTYYGEKIVGYHVPYERAIDINEPVDLKLAEFFLNE